MEIMLRCAVPDRPGALAALAGAVGAAGGDIQAVDVVEHLDGQALDDLVVVLGNGSTLDGIIARIEALADFDIEVVHAGLSRGDPGDAVARLAVGLELCLSGAMAPEEALRSLPGGVVRATRAELVDAHTMPRPTGKRIVLPFGDRALVLERDYRFTRTERERAEAVLRSCLAASPAHESR